MSDDPCVFCGEATAWGSGRYVNRVPADNGVDEGFACAECMEMDCDRCDKPIPLDEDIIPEMFHTALPESMRRTADTFSDGAMCVHYECLTDEERRYYDDA